MNVNPNSLPEKLVRTITGHSPERGATWLRELPNRLNRLAARACAPGSFPHPS